MAPPRSPSMQVLVKLFATYREIARAKELKVRLSDGATLRALLDSVYETVPRLKGYEETMILAVNHEFAEPSAKLREGDEVALMPPVSGGGGGVGGIPRKAIDVEAAVGPGCMVAVGGPRPIHAGGGVGAGRE